MAREEETITTTVAFDRATYKRMKLLAVENETTVRDIVREAVSEYLERLKKKGRKA